MTDERKTITHIDDYLQELHGLMLAERQNQVQDFDAQISHGNLLIDNVKGMVEAAQDNLAKNHEKSLDDINAFAENCRRSLKQRHEASVIDLDNVAKDLEKAMRGFLSGLQKQRDHLAGGVDVPADDKVVELKEEKKKKA